MSGTFDTLTAARALEAAGMDRKQAEAVAGAIGKSQGERTTRADLPVLIGGRVRCRSKRYSIELAGLRGVSKTRLTTEFAPAISPLPSRRKLKSAGGRKILDEQPTAVVLRIQDVPLEEGNDLMQPLSYQLAETTCWPACVLNGIRYLLKQDRVATPVYRIVHSLLQDRGVVYYEERDLEALKEVYWRLEKYTGLVFKHKQGGKVKPTLQRLELNGDQVAICDVGDGDHSILLTKKKGDWLRAFDSYWYDQREPDEKIVRIVDKWHANTEILQSHLLDDDLRAHKGAFKRGEAFPIGQDLETRFMTVIGKRS